MNVVYQEKANEWGETYALLQQATERLKELLGPSEGLAKAEWGRMADERGCTLYTLRISDFTGETAETGFTLDELKNPTLMRFRLYRLGGDLLRERNRKQLQELQQSGASEN